METTQQPIGITQQHKDIVIMLTEIEARQEELKSINKGLLQSTENTCSEYGDRILENMQSKLFYLQRVLRMSTRTLKKHEELLTEAINGSSKKSKQELLEYYSYCQKSAAKIRSKLTKYQKETKGIISNNC